MPLLQVIGHLQLALLALPDLKTQSAFCGCHIPKPLPFDQCILRPASCCMHSAYCPLKSRCSVLLAVYKAFYPWNSPYLTVGLLWRSGILIQGGNVLDALVRCTTVAFDKTGTLTTGLLTCTSMLPVHHSIHPAPTEPTLKGQTFLLCWLLPHVCAASVEHGLPFQNQTWHQLDAMLICTVGTNIIWTCHDFHASM